MGLVDEDVGLGVGGVDPLPAEVLREEAPGVHRLLFHCWVGSVLE